MSLLKVQNCSSTEPYHKMYLLSDTRQGVVYCVTRVTLNDPPSEYICTCRGFEFNGHCKHQHRVHPCDWQAAEGPEEQTDVQWEHHQCPRCGKDTVDGYAEVEDD